MAEKTLVDYLKKNTASGHSLESLKTALMNQGWSKKQVSEAAKEIKPVGNKPKAGKRPVGISFLAILGFLGSVLGILAGLAVLVGSFILKEVVTSIAQPILTAILTPMGVEVGFLLSGGIFFVVFGLIALLIIGGSVFVFWAYKKLWNMKKTGWFIVAGLTLLGLIQQALPSDRNFISIGINAAILAYLFLQKEKFV